MTLDDSDVSTFTARLTRLVETVVRESGDPTGFDAERWVAAFLDASSPALGGRPPREFLDTSDGRAIVFRLVMQMQTGTYA